MACCSLWLFPKIGKQDLKTTKLCHTTFPLGWEQDLITSSEKGFKATWNEKSALQWSKDKELITLKKSYFMAEHRVSDILAVRSEV